MHQEWEISFSHFPRGNPVGIGTEIVLVREREWAIKLPDGNGKRKPIPAKLYEIGGRGITWRHVTHFTVAVNITRHLYTVLTHSCPIEISVDAIGLQNTLKSRYGQKPLL